MIVFAVDPTGPEPPDDIANPDGREKNQSKGEYAHT
jgi:hypothetical protein